MNVQLGCAKFDRINLPFTAKYQNAVYYIMLFPNSCWAWQYFRFYHPTHRSWVVWHNERCSRKSKFRETSNFSYTQWFYFTCPYNLRATWCILLKCATDRAGEWQKICKNPPMTTMWRSSSLILFGAIQTASPQTMRSAGAGDTAKTTLCGRWWGHTGATNKLAMAMWVLWCSRTYKKNWSKMNLR